jgi:hypothetical protein
MNFTLRQLRAFHYVAEHRSFARVAERLLITPSGLSVLIRELERQLGFRLFDRTTRQVTPTAYGRDLLAVTEPALKTLDEAMSRIEQVAKRRTRWISIGTKPWIAANVLPPGWKLRFQRCDHAATSPTNGRAYSVNAGCTSLPSGWIQSGGSRRSTRATVSSGVRNVAAR